VQNASKLLEKPPQAHLTAVEKGLHFLTSGRHPSRGTLLSEMTPAKEESWAGAKKSESKAIWKAAEGYI
jgi:hypothetical protein